MIVVMYDHHLPKLMLIDLKIYYTNPVILKNYFAFISIKAFIKLSKFPNRKNVNSNVDIIIIISCS